jgi:hypothetical protein
LLAEDSNSHCETDFGVSSAYGAGNTKIGFLKASHRLAFKKPICIMRIAGIWHKKDKAALADDKMSAYTFLFQNHDRLANRRRI